MDTPYSHHISRSLGDSVTFLAFFPVVNMQKLKGKKPTSVSSVRVSGMDVDAIGPREAVS